MEKVIAHAPAKINLVLEVEALRAQEEKHRLNSIFCTTTLFDTVVFEFISGKEPFNAQVTFESVDFDTSFINHSNNTLIKTVEHFKREYGFGFLPTGTLKAEIIKSIPSQAGLGGGSSDAAAMLRMLCWLAQVEPLSERSLLVAKQTGADVPFFLYATKAGFCAHMGGYGDDLVQALVQPHLHIALVKPDSGVSTKRAFAAFDREERAADNSGATVKLAQTLSEQGSLDKIATLCSNNLEAVAAQLLPAIASIKEELESFPGVLNATMTGSGSALFALCENSEVSQACMKHFSDQGLWSVALVT